MKRARGEGFGETGSTQAAGAGAATRLERELEATLREFVRLRTVSSDPTLQEECFRGAKYLANLLESLGEFLQPLPRLNLAHSPVSLCARSPSPVISCPLHG